MSGRGFAADVAGWLRRLPPNAVVEWVDDSIGDEPWAVGWLDVYVPGMCEDLRMNWAWTIDAPLKDEKRPVVEADEWTLRVEPDLELWQLRVDGTVRATVDNQIGLTAADLPSDVREELRLNPSASLAHLDWRPVRGWRLTTIDAALSSWSAREASRSDIEFRYNADILTPAAQALQRHLSRMEAGEEETYAIGTASDGTTIVVTGEVLDGMLSMDPIEAADISRAMADLGEADEEES